MKLQSMTPTTRYQYLLQAGKLQPDAEQAHLITELQQFFDALAKYHQRPWWQKPFATKVPRGIYLWGDVGTGKTCMMDLFFYCLPPKRKLRIHFHRFMRQMHQQLTLLQGQKDPLRIIGKNLAQQTDVLCFDEFFVSDIVDAMLLAALLSALFKQGISLFTTSNLPPENLYKNGLQRKRFLPAIALLQQHTQVIHLPTQLDYRLQTHQLSGTYYLANDVHAQTQFKQHFLRLAGDDVIWHHPLTLASRTTTSVAYSHDVVWFKFSEIVNIPNCQRDYLELAQCFHTVFISEIPSIGPHENDTICNFIHLVDIFYDAQVKLILHAMTETAALYTQGSMVFEFKRTLSRLQEMQSREYLAKPHCSTHKFTVPSQLADTYRWEEE